MFLNVYRYEAEDGSGPFYNLNGTSKRGGRNFPPDDIRCGCDSINNLNRWFNQLNMFPNKLGYKVVHYLVDLKEESRYNKNNGHIEFKLDEVITKYDN